MSSTKLPRPPSTRPLLAPGGRRPLLVSALALAALAGCSGKEGDSGPRPGEASGPADPAEQEPGRPSAGPTGAPTGGDEGPPPLEALSPVIRETAEDGLVPSAITVELGEPIADTSVPPTSKTVLEVAPAVAGVLSWSSASTLVFTPGDGFLPDTRYSITLSAVETKLGVSAATSSGKLERVFTTPKFELARANFHSFDPKRHRLEVELVYSAAVEVSSLKANTSWSVNGLPVSKVLYERTERRNVARATLTDKRINYGVTVALTQDPGVRFAGAGAVTAPASAAKVKVNEGEPIDILASYVQEGASGFYVAVICKDAGAGEAQEYYWDNVVNESYYVSKRCALEESDALDSVHFTPPVKISVSPMRGGFRILGDFTRGSYSMRIDANARSMDGGVLKRPYTQTFSVPARKPQLSFVAQGRYLPRSAWKNLAVRHMNASKLELVVRHIPPENLVFWMGAEQETADERVANVILKRSIPLAGKPDTLETTWIDVGLMLPEIPRGVLELQLVTEGAEAKARLMVTDINLVAKQEAGGRIHVFALDMHENRAIPGVTVRQVVKSGRVISECSTDRLGGCVLEGLSAAARELDPTQSFALIASREGDVTYLKFDELKTAIADSQVFGRPYSSESPYRAAVYSDRGVYRPGETVHFAAILRGKDDQAPAEAMPVELELVDPRKKVARKLLAKTNAAGMISLDLPFDDFADTGGWELQLSAGKKPIATYGFNIEEFVPERMKVTAKAQKADLPITGDAAFSVEAQYLFGGSAAGSRVELSCELVPTEFRPKANAGYEYGVWRPEEKPAQPLAVGSSSGELGGEGKASLSCPSLTQRGSFAGTARLVAKVAVFEAGSGRTTQAEATALVHPESWYIGLQTGTGKVKANEAFAVEGIVVDWTGAPVKDAADLDLELLRVEHEHDWIYDDAEGHWSYRHYTRLASDGKLPRPAVKDGKFSATITAGTNAAAFVVRARAGRATTDLRIEGAEPYWWWSSENGRDETPRPMKPASIDLEAPAEIQAGRAEKLTFVSPFKGRALVSLETDRVLHHEWIDVQAGPTEWSFKLSEHAPNVYASVFVVKDPHQDSKESFLPSRAFGVVSMRVDPVTFRQSLSMDAPKEVRSNSRLEVKLDLGARKGAAEPLFLTVAAVDEGILSLTRFASPDPLAMIFDRRALGISTFETIGWNLLLPAGGPGRSEGGDEGGGAGRVQPVKPVALWSGVVEVPASGQVTVGFDVPQYRGSLRVMAVAAGRTRMGSAATNVLVRDPLVLQTTLPRFLTFGDNVEVPVFVTNMSGAPQEVEVSLAAEPLPVPGLAEQEGAKDVIEVKGGARRTIPLAKDAAGTVVFRVKALQAVGAAKLRVAVSAGALVSKEELDVPFVPAAPRTRRVQKLEATEGTIDLLPHLGGYVPTTERTTIWVTTNPYGDSFDHLKWLIHYPYGCIEQTTSATRPLLFVGNLVGNVDPALAAQDRIEAMVMAGVNRILSMQTGSGGFAYWPGESEATPWGTAYATHLLLDAQKLRYPVPEERVKDALEWIERELTTRYESGRRESASWYHWENAEAYLQYVLAVGGRGRKARIEKLIQEVAPKARSSSEHGEQLYMLKAALYLAGDRRYEGELKNPDVSPIATKRENSWSFYSDRRRRGFMLSTFTDLFGDDPAGEKLAELVAESLRGHSSGWYTTQELVWAVTGLGKRIGARPGELGGAVLIANGKEVQPQGRSAGAKSSDQSWALARASERRDLSLRLSGVKGGKVYVILASEGVEENATYKLGGEGLALERSFKRMNGEPIELQDGSLRLGELVYVELALSNRTGERIQNVAVVDRIPAGWEIENPRLGRGASALPWLDQEAIWPVSYLNLRDDRLEVFGHLDAGQTKKLVYALRAVTAGQFTVPPSEAEAMYYPDHWAREPSMRVVITGPWGEKD